LRVEAKSFNDARGFFMIMLTEIRRNGGTDMLARSCLLKIRGAVAPLCLFVGLVFWATPCFSATAGSPGANELVIAKGNISDAVIVRSPRAGNYERLAAEDLAKYIEMMTGAKLRVADTPHAIEAALSSSRPVMIVGEQALLAKPDLRASLASVVKKTPYLRSDGIVLRREANRVYVAGNGDEAHYFAAAELLRRWGVRWFMPGEFGECVPEARELKIGELDYAYSSPFEIRSYWISWLGDDRGREIFQKRNMMTGFRELPEAGHALGAYTKGLGKNESSFPLMDPKTAIHIANNVESLYAANKNFSLSIEDSLFFGDYEIDRKLTHLQWDKYYKTWSITDPMLELYNNVAQILRGKHPGSTSKIGFLAYSNMTLPPVRDITTDPMFFGQLAAIDIDPIHGMDDPRSPQKQEYRDILLGWAKATRGRLTIYDYDQSMLVWRDLPNPSHMAFREDVKHYRDAGILGVNTESRNALATTFVNLYLRARLMWNPQEDVDVLLDDFYPKFFGPAAGPMKKYWGTIFEAWDKTLVTEHEYFVAPAIYTLEVVDRLGGYLREAEDAVQKLTAKSGYLSRNEERYLQRVRFVRLGYTVLQSYISMVRSAATDLDFAAAVEAGERGLRARGELTAMNEAFTTTRIESGYAFWPGEVQQYRELLPFTNGQKGVLVAKLPLLWNFHRDPGGNGMEKGFLDGPIDLTFWKAHGREFDLAAKKNYPVDQWEMIRADLYVQAQGVRFPNQRSFVGDLWYRTSVEVTSDQAIASPHVRFPGLFNTCELYINGKEVARREQNVLWWTEDYRFEWDVSLEDRLRAGENSIALRCHNLHRMGGMFRRPFLYAPR
jgi:hypothetical protein